MVEWREELMLMGQGTARRSVAGLGPARPGTARLIQLLNKKKNGVKQKNGV